MSTSKTPLTQRPSWKALEEHYQKIRDLHLRTLFAQNPQRGEHFSAEAIGIYLDYSKHRITDETMEFLTGRIEKGRELASQPKAASCIVRSNLCGPA